MGDISDLKKDAIIELNGHPMKVTQYEFTKLGRGGSIARTKLKNLRTGASTDKTFQGSDKVVLADVSHVKAQYLYQDGEGYVFMDSSTYDQTTIAKDVVGDQSKYLKDGMDVSLTLHNDAAISVDLPVKVEFEVTYTEPAVKGDTTSQVLKDCEIDTGTHVMVPSFVNTGDKIRIDTRDGSYVERVRD